MGVDVSFRAVVRSRWGMAVMAAVTLSAVFLAVEGVVNGRWLQVLWIVLVVASAVGWWRETGPGTESLTRTPRLWWTVLISVALAAAGVLVLATQDSVLALIGGALLAVSSVYGAAAVYWGARAGRGA